MSKATRLIPEEVVNRLLTGMYGVNHDVPFAYFIERVENSLVHCRIVDIDTLKPTDEILTNSLTEFVEGIELKCDSLMEAKHFKEIMTWRYLYVDRFRDVIFPLVYGATPQTVNSSDDLSGGGT